MKKRLTPSMIVALIALFVALSGTAIAAAPTITGLQIKDHSIGLVDISNTTVAKLHGLRGPAGDQGPEGTPGVAGSQGLPGVNGGFDPSKVQYVTSLTTSLPSAGVGSARVDCPAGTKVIGGGATTSGQTLWASTASGNGWFAGAVGYGFGIGGNLNAYAICASP